MERAAAFFTSQRAELGRSDRNRDGHLQRIGFPRQDRDARPCPQVRSAKWGVDLRPPCGRAWVS